MSWLRVLIFLGIIISSSCSPSQEFDLIKLSEEFHASLTGGDIDVSLSYFSEEAIFIYEWTPPDQDEVETVELVSITNIRRELPDWMASLESITQLDSQVDGNVVTFTLDEHWKNGWHHSREGYAEFEDGKIVKIQYSRAEPIE